MRIRWIEVTIGLLLTALILLGVLWQTSLRRSSGMAPPWRRQAAQEDAAFPDRIRSLRFAGHDSCLRIVQDSSLYAEGWDSLPQPAFWRQLMKTHPDTIVVNVADNRQILDRLYHWDWGLRSKRQRSSYEDSLRAARSILPGRKVFFTYGQGHFYRVREVLPQIHRAVEIFDRQQVDPWYCQTILLIESPGQLRQSIDGAYGPFQLMRGVARDMGLQVNAGSDEREDLEKSAAAAARLIREICIPKTRNLLNQWWIPYDERDLWFRLLVMHVYHAGIGNVRQVFDAMQPQAGGPELIRQMWQTEAGNFGNSSQNYSQLALAALLELEALAQAEGTPCPGDSLAQAAALRR